MPEDTMSVAGILKIIENAEAKATDSTSDFQMSARAGQLSESIGLAMNSLREYGVQNALIPPDGQGDGYAKMFAEIAEGFSSLFSELNSMRSSYLPFDLVQDVPAISGEDFSLSEAVATQALMESYENTFFRMLGMPSTSDLGETEPLVNVELSGTIVDTESEDAFTSTTVLDKLDNRQLPVALRPGGPTSGVYNFLKASMDPVGELQKKEFGKIAELNQIIEIIRTLYKSENPGDLEYSLAQSLQSLISDNTNAEILKDPLMTERLMGPIKEMVDLFSLSNDEMASKSAIANFLFVTLSNSLELFEPNLSSEYTEELVGTMWGKKILEIPDTSLQSLHEQSNFWKYCYLLFPPVQDGRIAKCVNESKKLVAPPFSPRLSRTVNGKKLKSTLLEAVLRIRLDTIAGTIINRPNLSGTGSSPVVTVGTSSQPVSYEDIIENMGLLESLIIIRLFTAVHGFAIDVKSKIAAMKDVQHQTGIAPTDGALTGDGERTPAAKVSYCEQDSAWQPGSRCQLETMKTIEDSLLLLLGDNDVPEAFDLQEGVIRNSGIKSAHLMGATLSIMDIPRRWIDKQIGIKDEEDERKIKKGQDAAASKISSKLGIAKGVGAIDVLAFLIAFFTAKEKDLLGLLTSDQLVDLQKEFPDGFFEGMEISTTAASVNSIAYIAYDVYQLFRYAISPEGTSRMPDPVME